MTVFDIYMHNASDRGLELIIDDAWWWLKRNSELVYNESPPASSAMASAG